jgi:hypothetical protein
VVARVGRSVAGPAILAASLIGSVAGESVPAHAAATVPGPTSPRAGAPAPAPAPARAASAASGCGWEPWQTTVAIANPPRHGVNPSIKDGAFVLYQKRVFQIVGGAPLYVTSWGLVGGQKPVVSISTAAWTGLRQWPRNGTFVRPIGGPVYQFVDGAPLRVNSWKAVGGPRPYLQIDANDIDAQGRRFPWDGVSDSTVDFDRGPFGPTFIRVAATGRVYKLVGGSPQYVRSWAAYGGPKPTIPVDAYVVDQAGKFSYPQWWDALKGCPRSGATVRVIQNGQVYGIVGGAPVFISQPGLVSVPPINVDIAGFPTTADQPYLPFHPVNSATARSQQTGKDYIFSGPNSAPSLIDLTGAGYTPPPIDQTAIDNAGKGGVWNHIGAP